MKHDSYFTRALKAADPRFARVFDKMGYNRADLTSDLPVDGGDETDALRVLRERYQEAVGKKAYHAWDADELRNRIEAAGKAD